MFRTDNESQSRPSLLSHLSEGSNDYSAAAPLTFTGQGVACALHANYDREIIGLSHYTDME